MELLRCNAIGHVREIHAWTDRPGGYWKQGLQRPKGAPDVPETLKWDLWLGVAPKRSYHPAYVPSKWRGWYDFGTGAVGDMACHILAVAFWGLGLKDPIAVRAESSPRFEETFPAQNHVTWEFGASGSRAPVKLHWYDGGLLPTKDLFDGHAISENGSLFIGDKGKLYVPSPNGSKTILLPEKDFRGFTPPPKTLPESPGHHEEWIEACKTGKPTMSHFAFAGTMTESLLLGNIAVRTGQRIEWDARNMRITNVPEANQYVNPLRREGW
jgi:predicted dehydrogenase